MEPRSALAEEGASGLRSADPRWLLAERVAASPSFARSPRLAQLLLYLCRKRLDGEGDQLSEQSIATDVFGRGPNFDSASDTIVRSHMLRLRGKLETYFREEGADEPLEITVPRGRYIPSFQPTQAGARGKTSAREFAATEQPTTSTGLQRDLPVEPALLPPSSEAQGGPAATRGRIVIVVTALAAIVLLLMLVGSRIDSAPATSQGPATRRFWQQLFPQRSTTLLVAADSGLVLLHGVTGQNSTLGEYTSHNLKRVAATATAVTPDVALSLAGRRYTSFVDLELFNRLTHLPEALAGSYSLRFARDISIDELKNSNVILSGSSDANPWVEIYERGMNFVLEDDLHKNIRAFANRNPRPGEKTQYVSDDAEYGVLAYLANPGGSGNALIIEGTSVSGTESASDFLFNSRELEPFLEKIRRPDGSLPHFEVLVAAENLGGSAAPSHTIAWRVHPN